MIELRLSAFLNSTHTHSAGSKASSVENLSGTNPIPGQRNQLSLNGININVTMRKRKRQANMRASIVTNIVNTHTATQSASVPLENLYSTWKVDVEAGLPGQKAHLERGLPGLPADGTELYHHSARSRQSQRSKQTITSGNNMPTRLLHTL